MNDSSPAEKTVTRDWWLVTGENEKKLTADSLQLTAGEKSKDPHIAKVTRNSWESGSKAPALQHAAAIASS